MWIARDKDGSLWIHIQKPTKKTTNGFWFSYDYTQVASNLFLEVKWEDEEPRELILK